MSENNSLKSSLNENEMHVDKDEYYEKEEDIRDATASLFLDAEKQGESFMIDIHHGNF